MTKKDNLQNGTKHLQIIHLIMDKYSEYTKNSYNSTIKRQPDKRWARDLNKHFSQEDIQMAIKHMKKCSTLLAIKTISNKIKTMTGYHHTPTRTAILKRKMIVSGRYGETRTLIHCCERYNMMPLLKQTVLQQFLKRLHKTTLLYDLGIPLFHSR